MRSSVLIFVFATTLALAQGSALQSKKLKWSCDVTEITKLVQEITQDAEAAVQAVYADVFTIINDSEDCVEAFFSDLDVSALITCITDDVESAITSITDTVDDFINTAEDVAEQIAEQVEKCVTL